VNGSGLEGRGEVVGSPAASESFIERQRISPISIPLIRQKRKDTLIRK
jgi:hypothetical protein